MMHISSPTIVGIVGHIRPFRKFDVHLCSIDNTMTDIGDRYLNP